MHHLRSSSSPDTHKLHKHRSLSHIIFNETNGHGKPEEFRDDLSSQSSSNDAKSELSRKGSVKRTVKKVKKYFARRFSGHHPHHHDEANYSILSGSLVSAQFAYAALGRPAGSASTPNSPSGSSNRSDNVSRFISPDQDREEEHATNILDNASPDTLGDRLVLGETQPTPEFREMLPPQTQTAYACDDPFQVQAEFNADDSEPPAAENADQVLDGLIDQSFDSIPVDSGDRPSESVPFNDSDILHDGNTNLAVPDIPPTAHDLEEEVLVETSAQLEAGSESEAEQQLEEETGESAAEPESESISFSVADQDGLTMMDSIESFRFLDLNDEGLNQPRAETSSSANNDDATPAFNAPEPESALGDMDSSTSFANPETADHQETHDSEPVGLTHSSHPVDVDVDADVPATDSTSDPIAISRPSETLNTQLQGTSQPPNMQHVPTSIPGEKHENQAKRPPSTAYVSHDDTDDLEGMSSFNMFNMPYYLEAMVVALAASGVGVMLASGVYRLLRA